MYEVDVQISFARSQDSSPFQLSDKLVFPSNGWIRPAYLGLSQPNARMIAGIQTHLGIGGSVEHTANVSALTTAIGVTLTVERIGDV